MPLSWDFVAHRVRIIGMVDQRLPELETEQGTTLHVARRPGRPPRCELVAWRSAAVVSADQKPSLVG